MHKIQNGFLIQYDTYISIQKYECIKLQLMF